MEGGAVGVASLRVSLVGVETMAHACVVRLHALRGTTVVAGETYSVARLDWATECVVCVLGYRIH